MFERTPKTRPPTARDDHASAAPPPTADPWPGVVAALNAIALRVASHPADVRPSELAVGHDGAEADGLGACEWPGQRH